MNTLNALSSLVRGQVWLDGERGFDAARRPWNLAVDQPVAAVVEAADADDVVALVRHAGSAGLGIATQPNGHGATGGTDGTILLRTRRLDGLELGPPGSHEPDHEPYALYLFGVPTDPTTAETLTVKQHSLANALPTSGRKPFTFLNTNETVADAFTPDVLARLRQIERRYDPHNIFRSNFPVEG